MTLLAELSVRHTRRHQPTRRVAVDGAYLPTSGPGHGTWLLAAVVAHHLSGLDEEQAARLPRLLRDAAGGLMVPRRALRYRLQTDVHGLDRSRHRLLGHGDRLVVELDVHGAAVPQVLGAVLAAAGLPAQPRARVLAALRDVAHGRWHGLPDGREVRLLEHGVPVSPPPLAGLIGRAVGGYEPWAGVPAERRWAMEVFGFVPVGELRRDEVNRRFRRLLRDAHPDHGAAPSGAAARIAELTEARSLLLAFASAATASEG